MPLTDELIPFHLRLIPGQDTKNRDTLLETHKVELVQNGRFENEVGSIVKRYSPAKYNGTSIGSGATHSLYRYYTKTTQYLLAAHGSSVYVGTDSTGAMTQLKTGFTSGKKFTFEVYKDLCLMSNGYENIQVTDGTAMWELGACKAAIGSGAGNLDRDAYYYAVTIDADAYICGAVSNTITCDASNQKIELTNIPLGPVGTTNRKIFRTEGGGTTLKLLATIEDNTTTTYSDNIADGSLGADMGAVTDDMPKGRFIKTYRERLFVARDETNPSRIYYSNAYLPGYIQGTSNSDYADISPDDGDVITGIPILLGTMCVFKRNTIRKWNIDSADPDSWVVDDPISFEGCPAPYSIAQTPYGIFYKGWRHMYNFDGAFSRPIIDEFDVIDDIKSASQSKCVGFWHGTSYLLSYISSDGGTDAFDKVMRFNWIRNQINIDTMRAASFTALTGDDESGELYFGDSLYGYVYLDENYKKTISLKTKTQINGNNAYPSTLFSGLNDIYLGGEEEDPTIEIGWALKIDDAVGDINTGYPGAIIDRPDTDGIYTSQIFNIDASELGALYWNETLGDYGTINAYTRSGSSEAVVEAMDATITGATQANPCVITAANSFSNGQKVFISGVVGMTELNGNVYTVANASGTDFELSGTDSSAYTAYSSGGTASGWDGPLTTSTGSSITSSANSYFQFRLYLQTSNISYTPVISLTDGFVVKFTYKKLSTTSEDIPFYYGTGYRNFGQPAADKIYKKITVVHDGDGSYILYWETDDGQTGSWTVDMTTHPRVFEAFFPSTAYGRKIKFSIAKTDSDEFTLKEIFGLWTPRPIII